VATTEISYINGAGSIGGDGLETGPGVRAPGANGEGRRNVAEVIR
jgi:hypothetical protein